MLYTRGMALALTLALSGSLAAQSLGEVAAREKKRREAQKAAAKDDKAKAKSFTDEDLQKYTGADSGAETSSSGASENAEAATGSNTSSGSTGRSTARGPQGFEGDVKRMRAAALKSQLERCQASLTSVRAAQRAAEEVNPSVTVQSTRADANDLVERAKETKEQNIRQAKARVQQVEQECTEIEDSARQAGIPPGWIR